MKLVKFATILSSAQAVAPPFSLFDREVQPGPYRCCSGRRAYGIGVALSADAPCVAIQVDRPQASLHQSIPHLHLDTTRP
ncbi:MAG: hypothetical protein KDJ77_04550, partial [Rhodobiaceae bacterium]|nr:hypothetical protein [Rhodobiaceae bacterium]